MYAKIHTRSRELGASNANWTLSIKNVYQGLPGVLVVVEDLEDFFYMI